MTGQRGSGRSVARSGGFAMVVVLAAVAVLAVLTGTLALIVEREATGRPEVDALVRARAAVLDDLERARFRTQLLAGEDRRVTATAGRQGDLVDGRRGVAGVWSVEGTTPGFVGWLCGDEVPNGSGDPTPLGLRDSVVAEGPDDVVLVGLGSVAQRRDRVVSRLRVERPLPDFPGELPTPERVKLRVAHVVLDEGVKASLAIAADAMPPPLGPGELAAPAESAAPPDARWQRASVAAKSGLEALFPGMDGASAELRARAARIFTRSQARLLDPAVTSVRLRSAFHDVTLVSRAVLTSTTEAVSDGRSDGADPEVVDDSVLAARLRLHAPEAGILEVQPLRQIERGALAGAWTSIAPVVVEASLWLTLIASESVAGEAVLELKHETRVALWNASAVELTMAAGELEVVWEGAPELRIRGGVTDDLLYEGPCPERVRRVMNRSSIRWSPGEVVLLRGEDLVAKETGSIRWISNSAGAGTESRLEGVMHVAAISPAAPLIAVLRTRGNALSSLRAQHGFHAADVTARNPMRGEAERWAVAYGVSAAGPRQQDPRAPVLRGVESAPGSRWSADPMTNVDRGRTSAPEGRPDWATGVLWDVPETPTPSWLTLRALPDENGVTLGTPGAVALNRVFDAMAFRLMLDPSGAASGRESGGVRSFLERRRPIDVDKESKKPDTSAYWIRGAFNVNSTSTAAWTTLLRGVLDSEGLPGLEGFRVPRRILGAVARDRDARDRAPALAQAIVRRSQLRDHPFRSVGEFVSSGIVEAALAESGVNEGLPTERQGTPGWIDQADVLCRLAPRLVARSDTFLARAYADVLDVTTGRILARVWAEATFQRVPESVDRSGKSAPDVVSRNRRVEVVDFRWLLPDEV